MKILVTGAAGFVGSHICRDLLARGHEVRAADRPGCSLTRLSDLADRVELHEVDIFQADEKALQELAGGIGLCIHAAWNVTPGVYLQSTDNLACLHGTLRLFEQVWKAGVPRIAGLGTCFEYRMQPTPLQESSPVAPQTLYAAAKLSTLCTGGQLAKVLGGSLVWPRLFYMYGPHENASRLVPDLIANLLAGQRVPLTEGHQVRDFLHVADAASGIVAAALSDLEGAVNVCSGSGIQVRDLATQLGTALGRSDLLGFGERVPNLQDPPAVVGDPDRLRSATGWRPALTMGEGLQQTVAWWKARV